MRNIKFLNSIDIFEIIGDFQISIHQLVCLEVSNFIINLKRFERLLGSEIEDTLWRSIYKDLRKVRFDLLTAPATLNTYLQNYIQLKNKIPNVKISYPQFEVEFEKVLISLKNICQLDESPILDYIIENFDSNLNVGIVLKDSKIIGQIKNALDKQKKSSQVTFLTESNLKSTQVYEKLIIIGPANWYLPHIFSSPRSSEIHIVNFNITADILPAEKQLINSLHITNNILLGCRIARFSQEKKDSNQSNGYEYIDELVSIDDQLVFPKISWDKFQVKFDSDEINNDSAEAKLLILSVNKAVYVEDNLSKKMIIDLEDLDGQNVIKRVPVPRLKKGMYILMRTERGGDLVSIVADTLLGDNISSSKVMQLKWKNKLRNIVDSKGMSHTINSLILNGSEKANQANVRNWMSERFIKPKDRKDFNAILKIGNLEKSSEELWVNAKIIEMAHLKAGQYIRKLLIKQVLKSDMEKLKTYGTMVFEFPEFNGGSITASYIEDISPSTFRVPASLLSNLIDRDEL